MLNAECSSHYQLNHPKSTLWFHFPIGTWRKCNSSLIVNDVIQKRSSTILLLGLILSPDPPSLYWWLSSIIHCLRVAFSISFIVIEKIHKFVFWKNFPLSVTASEIRQIIKINDDCIVVLNNIMRRPKPSRQF